MNNKDETQEKNQVRRELDKLRELINEKLTIVEAGRARGASKPGMLCTKSKRVKRLNPLRELWHAARRDQKRIIKEAMDRFNSDAPRPPQKVPLAAKQRMRLTSLGFEPPRYFPKSWAEKLYRELKASKIANNKKIRIYCMELKETRELAKKPKIFVPGVIVRKNKQLSGEGEA